MITTADVVIVGAGPAGSTLSCLLADRGIEAIVVDRACFPRVKPCGETINPGAVRLLGELDLLRNVSALNPARIAGWKLACGAERGAVGMYAEDQYGLGMPRRDFDLVLLREAQRRGVNILEGTHVSGISRRERSGFNIECCQDSSRAGTIRTRFVIGADGLRSVVSRRLDMAGRSPKLRKFSITCRLRGRAPNSVGFLHMRDGYTVGLAPVHATEPLWNGTVVLPSRDWRSTTMNVMQVYESCVSQVTKDWTERPEVVEGPWTSGPFDRPVQAVAARDALLIGDAAGYFDPLTGQGVFQALRTAQLAAEAIERVYSHGERQSWVFARYARRVRREQVWTRAFQHCFEAVLSRDQPRRIAFRQLANSPRYMDRLVRFAGDALPARGLARLDLLARTRRFA